MATVEKQKTIGRPRLFRKKQQDQLARELLEETADFLSEGHWIRGQLHDGSGNHCAVGALISVSHRKKYRGSGVYRIARDMLYNSVMSKMSSWGGMSKNNTIYSFNDNVARDETEVVRAFKEASAADK